MSYLTTPTSFITVDGTQIAYREMSAGASRRLLLRTKGSQRQRKGVTGNRLENGKDSHGLRLRGSEAAQNTDSETKLRGDA